MMCAKSKLQMENKFDFFLLEPIPNEQQKIGGKEQRSAAYVDVSDVGKTWKIKTCALPQSIETV